MWYCYTFTQTHTFYTFCTRSLFIVFYSQFMSILEKAKRDHKNMTSISAAHSHHKKKQKTAAARNDVSCISGALTAIYRTFQNVRECVGTNCDAVRCAQRGPLGESRNGRTESPLCAASVMRRVRYVRHHCN